MTNYITRDNLTSPNNSDKYIEDIGFYLQSDDYDIDKLKSINYRLIQTFSLTNFNISDDITKKY